MCRRRLAALLEAVPADRRDGVLDAIRLLTAAAREHGRLDVKTVLPPLRRPGRTAQLRARADGAELRYTTDDPVVLDALHDWFAAQTSDHQGHAG